MNLNKVLIVGRLTADPELRTIASGTHVTSFSIATNRNWTDKDGQRKEDTEFHNIVAWGRQADIVSQFSKKGSMLLVEGRLQTRSWEGKDGQTRRTTEIVAERIQLGPRSGVGKVSAESDTPSKSDEAPSPKKEEAKGEQDTPMPVINLDSDDIKPEDLPF